MRLKKYQGGKRIYSTTTVSVERGKPQQQAVEVQSVGLASVLVERDCLLI